MNRSTLILIVFLGLFTGPVLALSTAAPKQGELMLVIAPPWVDLADLVQQAQGVPVGPVSAPLGILVTSASSEFVIRVKQSGAWAVLDGRLMAQICGVSL